MCFIVAFFITTSHPLRHPLQIIVCVGQIYGLILYYATSMFDHYYMKITYSRPEVLYFWGYYFFMNFIWMVFPGSMCIPNLSIYLFRVGREGLGGCTAVICNGRAEEDMNPRIIIY